MGCSVHKEILLSPELRRLGSILLDQQMWCWGRDICYPDGNLLVEYGFTRLPAPQSGGRHIASAYQRATADGILTLWGFGLWYSASSSIFLRRYEFRPRITDRTAAPLIWRAEDLPPLHMPKTDAVVSAARELLRQAAQQISAYERWVAARAGISQRQRIIEGFPNRRKGYIPAESMAEQWTTLAAQCSAPVSPHP